MYHHQTVARHSFTRGAAQARRLNAQRTVSPAIIAGTIADPEIQADVRRARATESFQVGQLVIRDGEAFYFVKSDFVDRHYVLVKRNGRWFCSFDDERVTAKCAAKVEAMRNAAHERAA